MDNQQENNLSAQLEEKLDNILDGFNKVLAEQGFPEIYVVEFAVKSLGADDLDDPTVCKGNPPRCSERKK